METDPSNNVGNCLQDLREQMYPVPTGRPLVRELFLDAIEVAGLHITYKSSALG
jgi:hypothetical protein